MKINRNIKFVKKYIVVSMIALIVISSLQTNHIFWETANAATDNNQWGVTLQIQDETNKTDNFAPFDLIQVTANITYGNAIALDKLVTFRIYHSGDSQNNITRIISTNEQGLAKLSFRIPISQTQASQIWNISATIQTPDGPIQQNVSFTSQWPVEITSLKLSDLQGKEQTTFNSSDVVKVELSLNNREKAQAANISISIQDSTGASINQTIVPNQQIEENSSKLEASIQIPHIASGGQATVDAAIFSGSFEGVNIPIACNKSATFTLTAGGTQPTATPKPTPTPTPAPFEVSMSLFSWLLVATGFFTFSTLYVFLRRKHSKPGINMPRLPSISPSPVPDGGQLSSINTLSIPTLPSLESMETQTRDNHTILSQLSKISSSTQKIQELKEALKAEKEQLTTELSGLNSTLEAQEKAIKTYFETIRREIEKSQAALSDQETAEPKKPNEQNN